MAPRNSGFARPEIRVPGFVTPNLTQGKKIARNLGLAEVRELWEDVVQQVEVQGLALGVFAELDARRGTEAQTGRILVPAASAEDWKRFLAQPDRQWRSGYSARTLADCWQSVRLFRGFPASVQVAFDCSPDEELHGAELLLGIPGHKVWLPGDSRASQTDLFALARTRGGLAAIAVECKVAESLGERVSEWIAPKRAARAAVAARAAELPLQEPRAGRGRNRGSALPIAVPDSLGGVRGGPLQRGLRGHDRPRLRPGCR